MMIPSPIDPDDQKRDLEAAGFLILAAILVALTIFGIAVALLTKWWLGL